MQSLWQVQYLVDLEVQSSWQVQYFVGLGSADFGTGAILLWTFVAGEVLCGGRRSLLRSLKGFTRVPWFVAGAVLCGM